MALYVGIPVVSAGAISQRNPGGVHSPGLRTGRAHHPAYLAGAGLQVATWVEQAPVQPPPAAPLVTVGSVTSSGARITRGPYSHPAGRAHAGWRVWVERTSDGAVAYGPILKTPADTFEDATGLSAATGYTAYVEDRDEDGRWSAPGSAAWISGNTAPNQPTAVSTTPGATRALLVASAYADPDANDAHYSTLWEVRRVSDGAVVLSVRVRAYDEEGGTILLDGQPPSLTQFSADPLEPSTAYEWRATYRDRGGLESLPSAWTAFTTTAYPYLGRTTKGLLWKHPLFQLTGPGTQLVFPDLRLQEGVVEVTCQGLRSTFDWVVGGSVIKMVGRYWLAIQGRIHHREPHNETGTLYTRFDGTPVAIAAASWRPVGETFLVKESLLDEVARFFGTTEPRQVHSKAVPAATAAATVVVGSAQTPNEEGTHLWTDGRAYRSHTIQILGLTKFGTPGGAWEARLLSGSGAVRASAPVDNAGAATLNVQDINFGYVGQRALQVYNIQTNTEVWRAEPEDGIWGGDVYDVAKGPLTAPVILTPAEGATICDPAYRVTFNPATDPECV